MLRSTLLFAGVNAAVAGALMVGLACLAAALLGWLRRPAVNRWLKRVTGACMVGLGVRTALERAEIQGPGSAALVRSQGASAAVPGGTDSMISHSTVPR